MTRERPRCSLSIALLLIALFLAALAYGTARSLADTARHVAVGSPADRETPVAPGQTRTEEELNLISKELFCPLCTGVRLDNCDLPLCDQMRDVIRQKLGAGETRGEIKAYFVEQYGETVTGIPPRRGGMILAWVLPPLALLVAGGWLYRATRRQGPSHETVETETVAIQPLPAEYVERLDRDLDRLA